MKKIVIIDYGLGNLFSVKQALLALGVSPLITNKSEDIEAADGIILPGVGAFNQAMNNMNDLGITSMLVNKVNSGTPLFGICLGLQLLFANSEEFGDSKGLGLLSGTVVKFNSESNNNIKVRVPQINWNYAALVNKERHVLTPLDHIDEGDFFYFVHSFYVVPEDTSIALTMTEYAGIKYTSAILSNNIFACQFHPEKSGPKGVLVYKNWIINNNLL
jgi:glutamine amidotransferase